MDFIERWFHLSPDGGNGTLEWLIVALAVAALVIASRRRVAGAFWWYVEKLGKQDTRDPKRVLYSGSYGNR